MTRREEPEYIPTDAEVLEKQLEMAHVHQGVLEEDIKNLEASIMLLTNSTPASHPENLKYAILNILQNNTRGLTCKDILSILSTTMPDMTKKHVNSMLYTMKVKKFVSIKNKSARVPVWVLAA